MCCCTEGYTVCVFIPAWFAIICVHLQSELRCGYYWDLKPQQLSGSEITNKTDKISGKACCRCTVQCDKTCFQGKIKEKQLVVVVFFHCCQWCNYLGFIFFKSKYSVYMVMILSEFSWSLINLSFTTNFGSLSIFHPPLQIRFIV